MYIYIFSFFKTLPGELTLSIAHFIFKGRVECPCSHQHSLFQSATDELRGIILHLVAVRMLSELPWWSVARIESLRGAGWIRGFGWISIVKAPGEVPAGSLGPGAQDGEFLTKREPGALLAKSSQKSWKGMVFYLLVGVTSLPPARPCCKLFPFCWTSLGPRSPNTIGESQQLQN